MLKKNIAYLVLAFVVFASFGLIVAEAITKYQAENIVANYTREGEVVKAEVTVYLQGNPYYAVGFTDAAGRGKGYLIVNATSGDTLRDDETAREILYAVTRNMGPDFKPEGLQGTLASIADNKVRIAEIEGSIGELEAFMKKPDCPYSLKKPISDFIEASETLIGDIRTENAYLTDIHSLQKSLADKLETENVRNFVAKNDEVVEFIETTMLGDFDKFNKATEKLYDTLISETKNETERVELKKQKAIGLADYEEIRQGVKDEIDRWRLEEKWVMEGTEEIHGVNWLMENMRERLEAYKPTQTPKEKGVPGFEALFAIAGLLAVVYLLRRRE